MKPQKTLKDKKTEKQKQHKRPQGVNTVLRNKTNSVAMM